MVCTQWFNSKLICMQPCPFFNDWLEWSPCTATCNGGFRSRRRTCINGVAGVDGCFGDTRETESCETQVRKTVISAGFCFRIAIFCTLLSLKHRNTFSKDQKKNYLKYETYSRTSGLFNFFLFSCCHYGYNYQVWSLIGLFCFYKLNFRELFFWTNSYRQLFRTHHFVERWYLTQAPVGNLPAYQILQ